MKKLIYLICSLSLFIVLSCNGDSKQVIQDELQQWTDSVLSEYENIRLLKIDSISESKSETSRKRIWLYSFNRKDYLLIDGDDTLVHNTSIFNESNLIITREKCSPFKNSKEYTKIEIDGLVNGVVKSLDCDKKSLELEYFSNGIQLQNK